MKEVKSTVVTALICVSALGIARVQAQANAASSPLDQLNAFVGNGTCTGNVMAMGKNPGHASTGKYQGEKILDGNWAVIHYDEDQTAANPKPYHVVQYFGYDAATKHYVSVLVDNNPGSGFSTGSSVGWKDGSFTIDETVPGKGVVYRDVMTTGKSGVSGHTGWMKDKQGKWVKTDAETCQPSS
jgi:hypothetical protein